jgi:competence protein ComEC
VSAGARAVRWTWVDLRLLPAAGGVWGTALAAPWLAPRALLGVGLAALVLAAALTRGRRRGARLVVLGLLAGVALGSCAAGVRGLARESSPLRALAEHGRTAAVVLELDGVPRAVGGAGPPRVLAGATVTRLRDATTTARLHDPVLLFAPADGWADLVPGEPVQARVTASPPRAGDTVVAVVAARGPPTPVGSPGTAARIAAGLRAGLAGTSARVLPEPAAGLLPGLVVGDTSGLDPVLTEDFRRAGLSHLTAVSGLNVS